MIKKNLQWSSVLRNTYLVIYRNSMEPNIVFFSKVELPTQFGNLKNKINNYCIGLRQFRNSFKELKCIKFCNGWIIFSNFSINFPWFPFAIGHWHMEKFLPHFVIIIKKKSFNAFSWNLFCLKTLFLILKCFVWTKWTDTFVILTLIKRITNSP